MSIATGEHARVSAAAAEAAVAAAGSHARLHVVPPVRLDEHGVVQRGLKRAMDVAGAGVLLLLGLPMLIAIAVVVRIDSAGPVLFAHRRLGRGGRAFGCLKFRSMHADAERHLEDDNSLRDHYIRNHFKVPAHLDRRVTRIGRFLRKTSLDELPQLWNVLVGDMSLVGPRPIVMDEGQHYGHRLSELLAVRPGLTGAWAVQGRSRVGYPERVEIELGYVHAWTLASDLLILLRTPGAVLSRRGAE